MELLIPACNSCQVIAIDFDGTIYDRNTNLPYEYAQESLKWFTRWNYKIVIFSARASTSTSVKWMAEWLHEQHILYDEITNIKPAKLTWIIDDRGINFTNQDNNWLAITEAIKKETFPWKQ